MRSRPFHDLAIAGRLVVKRGLPVSLIFFVTSRCNLLCRHCFYWEELNKKKDELELSEIEKIAASLPNLLTVSLTGGEPYLRPDLPEIAAAFERYSKVRNIQIPSNGYSVAKTLERAQALLQKVRNAKVATGVSLDGPRDVHNRIRQNPRSFDCALDTLKGLKELKTDHRNLSVGVALTVSTSNQDCFGEFYRFVAEELQPDAITITLVRGNPIDPTLKAVNLNKYAAISRDVIQYRRQRKPAGSIVERAVIAKEEETYRLISEAATADRRIAPCYAGDLIGILGETGDVYLCETLDRKMGNVRQFDCDFRALWNSPQADSARRYQKELGCQCTYECAMSINSLFSPKRALRILRNSLK
ncbi:MAG TPA: radical SAM protein [Acidobacteriota bacterium]|nr:radical SAM protein [Acidobacteriota bacterium]